MSHLLIFVCDIEILSADAVNQIFEMKNRAGIKCKYAPRLVLVPAFATTTPYCPFQDLVAVDVPFILNIFFYVEGSCTSLATFGDCLNDETYLIPS